MKEAKASAKLGSVRSCHLQLLTLSVPDAVICAHTYVCTYGGMGDCCDSLDLVGRGDLSVVVVVNHNVSLLVHPRKRAVRFKGVGTWYTKIQERERM